MAGECGRGEALMWGHGETHVEDITSGIFFSTVEVREAS